MGFFSAIGDALEIFGETLDVIFEDRTCFDTILDLPIEEPDSPIEYPD